SGDWEDTQRRRLVLATNDIMFGVLAKGRAHRRMKDGGLDGIELRYGDFVYGDFAGIRMRNASINVLTCGNKLQGSDFTNSQFHVAAVGGVLVDFGGARLVGAEFRSSETAEHPNLEGANFNLAEAMGAKFLRAYLKGAHFHGAKLANASFMESNLASA